MGFKKGMGKPAWNKGVPMSKEARQHLSAVRTGVYAGEKHPRWSGGKDRYAKTIVKKRDNDTCQKCGYHNDEFRGSAVDVDHILPKKNYPDLAYDINNMVTLCPNCHRIKSLKDGDLSNR